MDKYNNNSSFYIEQDTLINAGYLDGEIKSPYTGNVCKSYLEFEYISGDYSYIGHVECDGHQMDSDGNNNTYTSPTTNIITSLEN